MNDDIFESVPQRGSGEETAENRRINEIAEELRRRCRLHEEKSGYGKANGIKEEERTSLLAPQYQIICY